MQENICQVYILMVVLSSETSSLFEISIVIKIKTVTQIDTELLHNTDRLDANCS